MVEENKARNEMIGFAKEIAAGIKEKYPGDGRFLILDILRQIMLVDDYLGRS